jgi:hypothetical protein
MIAMHSYPQKTIVTVSLPRTAAEAKATVRRLNARSPRSVRGRGPRIDTAAIYAARRRPPDDTPPARPTPGRARTMRDVAADYYGAPDADALIPTTPRGAR